MERAIATDFILTRIVALIWSLASIAGRSAGESPIVRRTVLAILLRAEPIARRVVIKVASDLGWQVDIPRFRLFGDEAEEALALADRLAQLASMLEELLGYAARAASLIAWPAGWQGFRGHLPHTGRAIAHGAPCAQRRPSLLPARAPP